MAWGVGRGEARLSPAWPQLWAVTGLYGPRLQPMGMAALLSGQGLGHLCKHPQAPAPAPPPIEQPPQTGVAKLWAVKTEDFSPTSPSGLQVFFFEALCGLGVRTNNTKVLHLFRGLQGPSTQ